jgi:hypothetical protein
MSDSPGSRLPSERDFDSGRSADVLPAAVAVDVLELEVNALLKALEADRVALRPRQKATTTPDFWRKRVGRPERQDPKEPSWDRLMPPPASEWEAERREQRLLLKMLPRRLRRLANRVFNTHHRGALLDLVKDELGRRAAERGRLFETAAAGEDAVRLYEPRAYVPACDTEDVLREMAKDAGFRLRLFERAKATTKRARAINTWMIPHGAVDAPQIRLPRTGIVRLEEVLGLVATPLPHRPPEGLLLGLAHGFWALGKRDRPQRVLDWGAGNSAFTSALLATSSSRRPSVSDTEAKVDEHNLTVDEVEVLGDSPLESPFVTRTHAVPRGRVYDLVLIQLPPPCANRGGYRDRHKGLSAGRSRQERLRDLGRLGLTRWGASAPRLVRRVLESVGTISAVTVLVPLFEIGGTPGEARPALLEARASIVETLRCMGLVVTHDFEAHGQASSERWSCLIASESGGGCMGDPEDDEEIEELLRAV